MNKSDQIKKDKLVAEYQWLENKQVLTWAALEKKKDKILKQIELLDSPSKNKE